VAKSTKALVDMGFQMLALGSPVEFMESYEYRLLAQMIVAAKKQMPNQYHYIFLEQVIHLQYHLQ